jgi:hypothetical protein
MASWFVFNFGETPSSWRLPGHIHEILVEKVAEFPKARKETTVLGRFLGNGLLTNEGPATAVNANWHNPLHPRRIQGYAGNHGLLRAKKL